MVLAGGTFRTGASTGYAETVGTLTLTDNSTIILGTGAHTLTFAASGGVAWTSAKTLTIFGWTGTQGVSGTAGKIFFGTSTPLTPTQLAQIQFPGYAKGATQLETGEIVPTSGAIVISGSATIADGTSYTSLKAAFDALNLVSDQSGKNVLVKIVGSTVETATAVLNSPTTNWTSLTIYPTATGALISGNVTSPLIDLDGADNVTIDGRVNATGSTVNLTISNTNTGGSAIRFREGATGNRVQYANLKGSNNADAGGVILFNAATAVGNNNNVIDNNNITKAGNRIQNVIYSSGSATYLNSTNTVSNNNIYDCASTTNGWSFCAINLVDYNTDWTISGNSFYETAPVAAKNDLYFIKITNTNGAGNNFTVSNNYLGGGAPQCGGSAFRQGTGTANNIPLKAIYLKVGNGTQSKVQGNVIKNITWQVTAASNVIGIQIDAGNVLVGGATANLGNTIGASGAPFEHITTGNNNIINNGVGSIYGIYYNSTIANPIQNNSISYFTTNSTHATPGALTLIGINKANSAVNGVISNNTIDNLSAKSTGTNVVYGIQNGAGASITNTYQNNTITNLNSGATGAANVSGIFQSSGNDSGGDQLYSGNFIAGLTAPNATSGTLAGISHIQGVTKIYNNIISITASTQANVYGVHNRANATLSSSVYYNTVYIGGSTTGGLNRTAAYFSVNGATPSQTRNIRNNIFYNACTTTGGGTAKHYGAYFGSATRLTVDYNDYYVTDATYGWLGFNGTADVAKTETKVISAQDGNSTNLTPNIASPGTTAASYKGTAALTGVDLSGIVGDKDYAGDTRKTLTQMGAFFIPGVIDVSIDKNISELSLATSSQIEVGAGATLTLNQAMGTEISKIVVKPTGKISLGSNAVTATNGIVLQSDATGTATLTGDNAVTNATVQQYVTAGRNWYVSPSVSAAGYTTLSRGTSVVEWNEASKAWDTISSGTLVAGRGYIQVATSTPLVTGTTGTVNFTGTTNAGDVTTPSLTRTGSVATSGFNLVGNPYPSYLRWSGTNSVITDANNSAIGTSFWYRTKNNADAYIFVTHNGTSGYTIPADQTPNTTITGVIPPMQAFWVRVTGTTTMKFTNVMRLHADNAENKLKAPKNDERQRLRLQLANGTDTDEALIYFDAAAANSFDNYDSPKMLNNSTTVPDLYSKADNEKLVINGLTEVTDNMTLPLGFTLKAAATGLTLKVSELSNFAVGTKVYLVDSDQNTQTELLPETQYTFNTTASTSNNESRFSLLFRAPSSPNAVNTVEKLNAQVFVNAANQITIVAPEKANYAIYNAVGMLLENGQTTAKLQTVNCKLNTGVYIVKVANLSTRVIIK